MAQVVVGIDGSAHSREVLLVADTEARWRYARLDVVYLYALPWHRDDHAQLAVTATAMWPRATWRGLRDATDGVRSELVQHRWAHDNAVRRLERCVAHAGLRTRDVEQIVVGDVDPARTLLRLASSADLLVVGTPDRRRLGDRLLGSSVHRRCVSHARCPVLIVAQDRHAHAGSRHLRRIARRVGGGSRARRRRASARVASTR
ncbi:MAG: universal stress protein [Actinobacteria bacterium]|nr:universal stress protein [Actinomycetota bacterium]